MLLKDCLPKVVMVLNIIVGFCAAAQAVFYVLHYLDMGSHG